MSLRYNHSLLFVDDEESITKSLHRLFRREGHEIDTATNGQEGLDRMRVREEPYSLIISDQRMPGLSGVEFLEKTRTHCPDAMRLLLTGYTDMDVVIEAVNRGKIHQYMTKPWNDDEIIFQVRQALEQYELVLENRRLLALTKKQNEELSELNQNLEKKVEERTYTIHCKNKELSNLNRELEQNLFNSVRAFTALSEMQFPSVIRHGRRVGVLSRDVCLLLNLDKKAITHIEIAALLHDIGKLGLPEKLLAPQRENWTPEEKALFQKHPAEGQAVVQFIKQLDQVGHLIRAHHERLDGQGFPDRLKGDEIPLGAKIITVADTYDTIMKQKVNVDSCIYEYLKQRHISQHQLPQDELRKQVAIHHLRASEESQFDSKVVEAFINTLKTKGVVYKGEPESQQKDTREEEVTLDGLKPGMVLARSVYSAKGRFLLPYDTELSADYIKRLLSIHANDPIKGSIFVVEK